MIYNGLYIYLIAVEVRVADQVERELQLSRLGRIKFEIYLGRLLEVHSLDSVQLVALLVAYHHPPQFLLILIFVIRIYYAIEYNNGILNICRL